jgi:ABA responsive element binding factor
MGTNLNFKNNFVIDPPTDGNCNGRPPGNFPLARQSSVYSLTFDEFQNTMGGSLGKDFGSMNMDELLKNIWSAEETQTMTNNNNNNSIATGFEGTGPSPSGFLQRQGSLTLPRTLSQKTVDEVWRDLSKDESGNGSASLPQRQQTLGEITLEEFLVRAGVVREDAQLDIVKPDSTAAYFGNSAFGYGFGNTNNINNTSNNNSQFSIQSSNLPLNVNGVRSNQSQLSRSQQQQQQQQQQQHQQQQQQHQLQILPKQQATVGYATHQMAQLGGQGVRGGIVGIGDQGLSSGLVQTVAVLQGAGGGMGMVGLGGGGGAVTVAAGSPVNQLSSDGIGKSNGDMSSVSPVPYGFNGGLRGRRSGAVEKVVERRQRRMIKNRESAARSRARKQVNFNVCLIYVHCLLLSYVYMGSDLSKFALLP